MSISSLKTEVAKISSFYRSSNIPLLKFESDNIIFHDDSMPYIPSPTAKLYHNDNSQLRIIMGAIRSGKSTASCAEIIKRARNMPRCNDGVRRAICLVIRNTFPMLETTTLLTWKRWFGRVGMISEKHDSPIELVHRFSDGDGIIELKLWFMALDKPKDIDKLLSLEVSFAYINEGREVPYSLSEMLLGRIGQYPMAKDCPDIRNAWSGVFIDTNPPDIDSWIYDKFEKQHIEGFKMFRQPPAMLKDDKGIYYENPEAENINNLPVDYYKRLLTGASEEFIKVYVLGEYGTVNDGKLVYANYNDDLHSVPNIEVDKSHELLIALDGGLTPAALITQMVDGQIRAVKEFTTDRMLLEELAQNVLAYISANFNGFKVSWTCDPSLNEFDIAMLYRMGVNVIKARTNDIEPRINAVSFFLNRMSSGMPSYLISRFGCPVLRKGHLAKYCYRRVQIVGEEKFRDVPDKVHPHSDIHDCMQYSCLWYNNGNIYKKDPKQDNIVSTIRNYQTNLNIKKRSTWS
jgi:hypothetical protein